MLDKIIISIIFILINALILWVVSGIVVKKESYKKALFATSLLFLISLLYYIRFQGQGFYGTMVIYFFGSRYFIILFSSLVLWLIYRHDWNSFFFMLGLCIFLHISFNGLLPLAWDSIMQIF